MRLREERECCQLNDIVGVVVVGGAESWEEMLSQFFWGRECFLLVKLMRQSELRNTEGHGVRPMIWLRRLGEAAEAGEHDRAKGDAVRI